MWAIPKSFSVITKTMHWNIFQFSKFAKIFLQPTIFNWMWFLETLFTSLFLNFYYLALFLLYIYWCHLKNMKTTIVEKNLYELLLLFWYYYRQLMATIKPIHRHIKKLCKHLRWNILEQLVNGLKALTIFAKSSILDV